MGDGGICGRLDDGSDTLAGVQCAGVRCWRRAGSLLLMLADRCRAGRRRRGWWWARRWGWKDGRISEDGHRGRISVMTGAYQ